MSGSRPSSTPLVSVIIPCYNAEPWVGKAIESALAQSYRPLEVVVVDDGSTDGSPVVIGRYGDRVIRQHGPNRGGSAARNLGFRLSRGELIQWLDADDYLLPEKIARQVGYLHDRGLDGVVGDWRDEWTDAAGGHRLGPVVSASSHDILFDLLRGHWTPHHAYLMRRRVVEAIDGWDETLPILQDPDFLVRACAAGARFGHQPGCHAIYRRHGAPTVSTRNRSRYPAAYARLLDRAARLLEDRALMTPRYRQALALSHFHVARNLYETDRTAYERHLRRAQELDPDFRPRESRLFNAVSRLVGLRLAERAAVARRRWASAAGRLVGDVRRRAR